MRDLISESLSSTGTLASAFHLVQPSNGFWNRTQLLPRLFDRWYGASPANLSYYEIRSTYLEAGIASNVILPGGVRMVLSQVGANFGASHGDELRALCTRRGWALLWALGTNSHHGSSGDTFEVCQRVLDPVVAAAVNIDVPDSKLLAAAYGFERARLLAARRARTLGDASRAYFDSVWRNLTAQSPPELQMRALSARDPAMATSTTVWGYRPTGRARAIVSDGHCW